MKIFLHEHYSRACCYSIHEAALNMTNHANPTTIGLYRARSVGLSKPNLRRRRPLGHPTGTACTTVMRAQGWKFMSCSHCQDLCQQVSWILIGYTSGNNQFRSQVKKLTQFLTMT